MALSFLARDAGRIHVCGHRGYSLHYPENTLPAFEAAKAAGATTVEIDVVLTAEGEPIILHDLTVDRTTDGHGFAADLSGGRDPLPDLVQWIADGLIDTISGDDVPFIAMFVSRAGRAGWASPR